MKHLKLVKFFELLQKITSTVLRYVSLLLTKCAARSISREPHIINFFLNTAFKKAD